MSKEKCNTLAQKNVRYLGLDISVAHGAAVVLNRKGKVILRSYFTTRKAWCVPQKLESEIDLIESTFIRPKDKKRVIIPEQYIAFRRSHVRMWFNSVMDYANGVMRHKLDPVNTKTPIAFTLFANVEDYAYAAASRSSYQIGEVAGILRDILFYRGGYSRFTVPSSLQKWICGGKCLKKPRVLKAIKKGLVIPKTTISVDKNGEYDGPCTDLADAFWLANMVRTECRMKRGKLTLDKLSQSKRDVFLSVTKTQPVGMLTRPFIHWD